jgi:hypothetical protein
MTETLSGICNSSSISTTVGQERILISNSGYTGTGLLSPSQKFYVTDSINANLNNSNMISQVKVAVFKVKRSEETDQIVSTKFLQEMWVEVKPNTNLNLLVAAKLDLKELDPETLVVRELLTCTFYN